MNATIILLNALFYPQLGCRYLLVFSSLFLNDFNVVCWIQAHLAIFSSFAPALFVFIFQFLKCVPCFEVQLVTFRGLVVVEGPDLDPRLAVVDQGVHVVPIVVPLLLLEMPLVIARRAQSAVADLRSVSRCIRRMCVVC